MYGTRPARTIFAATSALPLLVDFLVVIASFAAPDLRKFFNFKIRAPELAFRNACLLPERSGAI